MIYTPLTKKALRLSFEAHKDQTDQGGMPYVFHPFHLAEQMPDEMTTVTALLHDTVEDSWVTPEYLRAEGYPEEVIEAIGLLTHPEGVPYMDYVRKLRSNPIARTMSMKMPAGGPANIRKPENCCAFRKVNRKVRLPVQMMVDSNGLVC